VPPIGLPIIERLVSLYKLWYEVKEHFPKKSKFTLGAKIDIIFNNILELTLLAGNLPKDQKLPYLQKAISQFDLLKFFLRVAWEIKALDNKKYLLISEPLVEIGKMLGGWKKGLENKTPANFSRRNS